MELRILGVYISDRIKEAGEVQKVLTKYGCSIKTRLGLHEASETKCATTGLLILELTGDLKECDKLEHDLTAIKGIEVKNMIFNKK